MSTRFETAKRYRLFIFVALVLNFMACSTHVSPGPQNAIISIDNSVEYQTMNSWQARLIGTITEDTDSVFSFFPKVFDGAVNDLGINQVALEIYAGEENTQDWYAKWQQGEVGRTEWRAHIYDIENDNNDPNAIDDKGFHFSRLDFTIDNFLLPLKQLIEARGERLIVNLLYVDFGSSTFEHADHPEEYAEFILAAFKHMESTYGFVPDGLEVKLEPDHKKGGWKDGGVKIAKALLAAGKRLEASGYTPEFIAPSTVSMGNASTYFDTMITTEPEVLTYIDEISYHRYSGVSAGSLRAIADFGRKHNLRTSMLEWWHKDNSYKTLHEDIKAGGNSTWEQGILGDEYSGAGGLYHFDGNGEKLNPRTKYNRQYFKFIHRDAVRIKAASDNDYFDPLAFINEDGTYVVVCSARTSGSLSVRGLLAGTYGIKYTTGTGKDEPIEYDVDLADQIITTGQQLETSIPDAGVITIYAR